MSADRLAEIKARCDAATEGPWVRDMHSPDMSGRSGWYIRGPRKLGLRSMVLNSRMLSGDAEFVEAAREDVPWLVEQVERLTAERDALARLTRENEALRAKVAAVEALHWDVEGKCAHCRDCYHDDYLSWPCPTAAAQADQA